MINTLHEKIEVEIRGCDIGLLAPKRKGKAKSKRPCSDREIYAVHIGAKDNHIAFEWILLTSLPVDSINECLEVIWIYKQRWHIEMIHKALKSSFKVEKLTLGSANRLKKAIAILLPCAVRAYWLLHLQTHYPDDFAGKYLNRIECKILKKLNRKDANYSPTVKEAWLWIGYLGGFRGSKGSKPPGLIIFWRGFLKLREMAIGAALVEG